MFEIENLEIYKDVPLIFDSYYKYVFYYKGIAKDGTEIITSYGGNHDDIYRFSVDCQTPKTIGDNDYDYLMIKKDNKIIYEIIQFNYNQGMLIQDAFKSLDAGQREWLMTGFSDEGWNRIFSEETSSDCS